MQQFSICSLLIAHNWIKNFTRQQQFIEYIYWNEKFISMNWQKQKFDWMPSPIFILPNELFPLNYDIIEKLMAISNNKISFFDE